MELSDLAVFRSVARTGGVTRAAQQLHRVQSNVTTRIKKLEDRLGVTLFVREGRGMRLSAHGAVLLEYAERLLALADEARDALRDSHPRGTLRLGAMESTAAVRLPAVFARLHARHPELAVELRTGDPQQLASQVLAGELDAALVAEPVSDVRLGRRTAFVEELVVVAQAGHAPVRSAKDVSKRTLLAFAPGCPHRQRLEQWFARARVLPERTVELTSYHAILGCAAAGMGVALMPKSVLDAYAHRSRLSVHGLSGSLQSVKTLLVWRKDTPQARVNALVDALDPAPAQSAATRSSASTTNR
jgi:DNA-binding transcriptional LysR family regulator